ncbi:MAG TPA: SDR family oxidoreductase [Alphaproteobacteria bacterium]|nr:SDR family oxidoreductase [Alphaproteobacteria bacterium]
MSWANVKFDYSGRKVLVVGGTTGIGFGVARAYREAGAEVTITGQRASAADYDADYSGFGYHKLDITALTDMKPVADALPALDILVNSAGVGWVGGEFGVHEYEPEIFEKAVRMHLTGPYRTIEACQPKLSASTLPGGGSVISIASMASFFGIETVPGYGAAKAGLVQMTKTLAIHWGKQNLRVNAVAAGLTKSAMTAWFMDDAEMTAPTLQRTPLDRIGEPEDIAGAVLYLTSAAARHITGQTVIVDGGYSIFG